MTLTDRIVLVVATARTATVELVRDGGSYALPAPRAFTLATGSGVPVDAGQFSRHIVTLDGLLPATPYRLEVAGAPALEFETPHETAHIDISAHGADQAAEDNAAAIQAAIDAAPAGTTLHIPPGTWRSGPILLKSQLTLHLADGATLLGLAERSRYPSLPALHADGRMLGSWEGEPAATYASLVTAIGCTDIAITGRGTIDGNAAAGDWWRWPKETRDGLRRPRTIFLTGCRNVALTGIAVRNSPSWTIHPLDCHSLVAADLRVENPADSPNTDGLNPESATDIRILGVHFSVGDDCIAIKAGKRGAHGYAHAPTRRVEVRRCLMEFGHGGVVIGSEMSGGVEDVAVSHCRFVGTDRGLRIKTRRGRGGFVRGIRFEDVEMDGVLTPVSINSHYFCDPDGRSDWVQARAPAPVDETTPQIADISVRRVTARNVHHAAAFVLGLAEAPVARLSISEFAVSFAPEAVPGAPDMACDLPELRHAGIVTDNLGAAEIAPLGSLATEPDALPC